MELKNLIEKKVLELREYARNLKVPKYSRMRKEELIEKILKRDKGESIVASPKLPHGRKKTPQVINNEQIKEEGQLDRTEAETRLKMKEAFASSQTAQKEYFPPKQEYKVEHKPFHVKRDKFSTGELPFEYHKDRIALLVIDPNFFYVYWEVTHRKQHETQAMAGWDSHLTLKVYDVTDIRFNGFNAHSSVDVDIYERIGCWYIRLDKANRDLVVDIGYKNSAGQFFLMTRSNFAKLPPVHMAPEGPIKWMAVDDLGNYVITDIEEYTDADLILLRKILGEDLFRRFLTGDFRGMLFSTVFKKVPNIKEISFEFPTSSFGQPTSSGPLVR